jgi:transcription elongation factor GreA
MSPKIELSKATYDYLTKQLVQLDEQKMALLNDYLGAYAPGAPVDDLAEISRFLGSYINYVQDLLRQARVLDDDSQQLPLTFIGCDIQVKETETDRTEVFRVVSPYEAKPAAGHISFLSPVGRKLLLKKPGDVLEVKAPGGTFHYEIISVSYPGD